MKIVHIDELPVEERAPRGRPGMAKRSLIMTGEDSSRPDNFSFRIMHFDDSGRFSPKHRHNFAQYYYVLEGETVFGDATLSAGWLGYMPEGVFYGPQTGSVHSIIVLQHGGPSGQGIIGYDQHSEAFEALKQVGSFEKGIFRPNPGVQAPAEQDSYEAIWEHVHQRPLVYPEAQYSGPVNMDTNAFRWFPTDGASGVCTRQYGTFTDCHYGACGYRIESGSEATISGRGMCIVLHGAGTVAEQEFRRLTTVYLDTGDEARFAAEQETEILFLGMPRLDQMGKLPARRGSPTAVAA